VCRIESLPQDARDPDSRDAAVLSRAVSRASAPIARVLDGALSGRPVDLPGARVLDGARGDDLHALVAAADHLRAEQAGDRATYVVNRNVNFTNLCVKACRFCAFSRTARTGEAYFLPTEEVVRRAVEAWALGATEICLQAGLPPGIEARFYPDLQRAVRAAAPGLHIHAWSPEEVKFGARLARKPISEWLAELKDAGLGSLPGTSAEILDDGVRARIAPGRITTAEWIEVVTSAHRIGLPTTATIMYGHVETPEQRVKHLLSLRTLQEETGGFTEIVPLSFVHEEAPMFARRLVPGLRAGPGEEDVVRLTALTRLVLGASFRNVQVSWVKQGLDLATRLLHAGANDLGGTLVNESISTSAGAGHGQLVPPSRLREAARAAGRIPAQRDTGYRLLREFPRQPPEGGEPPEPLDRVTDVEGTFGSYARLVRDPTFRVGPGPRPREESP